ncbi:MAG: tetratricopeptide repeat protein [Anaerolineales bacterium]|nr:tetratricopeptide repeat protein [Anaerolineales bacterium]
MAGDRQRFQDAMRTGAQHAWDNDWSSAIVQFETARTEFPEEPAPYSHLGQAYFNLSQYEQALKNYQQSVRLDPTNISDLSRIADILERMGSLNQAAKTYMAVAEAHIKRHESEPAIDNWERASRLDPNLVSARQRLALVYYRQGRVRDSIREHLALARIHQSKGNVREAARVCKAALELDPGNNDVLAAVDLLRRGVAVREPTTSVNSPSAVNLKKTGASFARAVKAAVGAIEQDSVLGWSELDQELEEEEEEEISESLIQSASQAAVAYLAEIIFGEDNGSELKSLSKQDRNALVSNGISFQTHGEIDLAIEAYEKAIKGGVNAPAANFNLGTLYQEQNQLDRAIECFQKSLIDPEFNLASHFTLGECYRARGRLDDSIDHFLKVAKTLDVRSSPDQTEDLNRLYENMAEAYENQKNLEQAVVFSNSLVELLGSKGWEQKIRKIRTQLDLITKGYQMASLAEILSISGAQRMLESISLANEYMRRKWQDTAVEESYRAIQIAPFFLPAHLNLAQLLEQRGNIEPAGNKYVAVAEVYRSRGELGRAMDVFEKAMTLAPLDMALRVRLIDMLKRHGQIDRALEHSIALAESYYQLAQIDKARDKYKDALKLAPRGSPDKFWQQKILHRLADIEMQRLNWREAISAYYQIVRSSPEDERANVTLAELLFKMNQPYEALAELDRFLARLAAHGRTKKILKILEEMLSQQSNNMGLLNRLAAAYAQAGKREKAIEHLDRLGELQLDAGLRKEAANTIRAILSLNPEDEEGYRALYNHISGES